MAVDGTSWCIKGKNIFCTCWISPRHTGHVSQRLAHETQANACAHGKNAESIGWSMQIWHVNASINVTKRSRVSWNNYKKKTIRKHWEKNLRYWEKLKSSDRNTKDPYS